MPNILIDTNLLIYLVDQNEPVKQAQAKKVLEVLEIHHNGRLSVQNLAEFVNVTTRRLHPPLTPGEALEWAGHLARIWQVFDLTPQIVLEAARGLRDHSLSFFDAQIWAVARFNQIPLIFSEDFQDGMILEGVRFVNPFTPGFVIDIWL
jgi:predicted nucleic acid-binding protein